MMSSYKEYLKSSLITFVSAFLLAVVPFIGDMEWNKAVVSALIFAGVRAGVKAVAQYFAILKV